MAEVPASLRRRGIERAVSNREPEQAVVLPGGLIEAFFGEEFRQALEARQGDKKQRRRYLCAPSGDCE